MENKGKLGLLSICLLGVNAIVGTGIFLLPGKAAKLVGVSSIGVILFDAVLVILIALCFAEAGGLFKKNGGPYVYAKEAFGEFVGFEVGFMMGVQFHPEMTAAVHKASLDLFKEFINRC